MKVLLIGMDGAHTEVFNRGWTPLISSMIENKKALNINNDLLSRGWLEIATGQHANITTAMYDRPKVNGTLLWQTEFSINDIPGSGQAIKPLWQVLSENNIRVGVMNLPTTFPAPQVNGFFVSGGGGGAPVTAKPTAQLCYPKDILSLLHDNDYIVDDRLYQLVVDRGLTEPQQIFERLAYKNERRTDSFIQLNKQYNIDFGFIVYKTSSVLAETLLNAERKRRENPSNRADEALMAAIKQYYHHFDQQVQKLTQDHPECEVVFVSDHGMVPRACSVNPNVFLQQHGYQHLDNKKALTKGVVSKIKELIPFSVKAYLKKTALMKAKNVGQTNFNHEKTLAFCKTQGDWNHGIYINDRKRFGGPVAVEDIAEISEKIANDLNKHPDAKKHQLSATATLRAGKDPDHFPDITFSLPDGYLTSDKSKHFIEAFSAPQCKSALAAIMKGDILSMKSHHPLAFADSEKINDQDYSIKQGDLTVMYQLILDRFSCL